MVKRDNTQRGGTSTIGRANEHSEYNMLRESEANVKGKKLAFVNGRGSNPIVIPSFSPL